MAEDGAGRRALLVPPRELSRLIVSLPVFPALAASGRRLTVLAPPEHAALVRLTGAAVATLPAAGEPGERQALRRGGFTEAVFLTSDWQPAWQVFAAGIGRRWGYRHLAAASLLLDRPVRPPAGGALPGDAFRELLAAMGAPPPVTTPPWLGLDDAARQAARQRLQRAHLEPDAGPLLGIYPGAQGGAAAPWPRASFEALVRGLRQRHRQLRLVLLTTVEELWPAVRIFEETARLHPVLGPDLDLAGLAAVLAELDAFVGGDSWMLRLAAAAGTPCLSLLPRGVEEPAPRVPGSREVRSGGRLKALAPEVVLEAFSELWEALQPISNKGSPPSTA